MVSVSATMDGQVVEIVEVTANGLDVYVTYISSSTMYVKRKLLRNDSEKEYMTIALSATAG